MIPQWLLGHAQRAGDREALLVARDSRYRSISWNCLAEQVGRYVAALRTLQIAPGDRVAHVSENRYEWILLDLALLAAGGVHVPIHVNLSGRQMAEQIEHSGAKLAVVSSRDSANRLADGLTGVSQKPQVAVYDRWRGMARQRPTPLAWQEVVDGSSKVELGDAIQTELEPHRLATIMYTSGTSGKPRGVMLSHQNLAGNARATAEFYDARPDELRLCFLPLSHIYARTCDLYTWLFRGSRLALAQNRETILDDCAAVQPTVLNGVPYFFEKLLRLAESSATDDAEHGPQQRSRLVQRLGGRLRHCFSGGAPLDRSVEEAFRAAGVPVYSGYGLTEASPVVTASSAQHHRLGAVGKPIAGVELHIADDGEILTRGPHVMQGYWHDQRATHSAIRDRWLHTGDVGRLDEDGFLFVTGRKKETLITATGHNVAPAPIEAALSASPLVAQVMVVGDRRPCLAALIVPDPDALRAEMRRRRVRVFSRRAALRNERVRQIYRAELDQRLRERSHCEQIAHFALVERAFSVEKGEITPKGSLRREVIAEHFSATIDRLYAR